MSLEQMFDARSWIESQKYGSEIEVQMKYFCLYNQEYRDAIDKIIDGHRLNFIKFDELIDDLDVDDPLLNDITNLQLVHKSCHKPL